MFLKSLRPDLVNVMKFQEIFSFLFQESGMAKSCYKVDCDVFAEAQLRMLQGCDFKKTIVST